MDPDAISSAVGSRPALNTVRDQEIILRLFSEIDESDGGPRVPLLINPVNGVCHPNLIAAITNFQTHQRAVLGRAPDGRVDPNGATWRLMKTIASVHRGTLVLPPDKLSASFEHKIFAIDANGPLGGDPFLEEKFKSLPDETVVGRTRILLLVVISVQNMASQIVSRVGKAGKINELTIIGHGDIGLQVVGAGRNVVDGRVLTIRKHSEPKGEITGADQLRRLTSLFAKDAIVSLTGCNVALGETGEALLKKMSETLGGVWVQGGKLAQLPAPGFTGSVVRCNTTSCMEVTVSTSSEVAADVLNALLMGTRLPLRIPDSLRL